eukprot:TRINITY_DN61490_c0_g1_i1.p1 TRINITY_DN61490_c0_g1~~TRINITY_DN61490_c0_g1_i1.p1  ORF type:complete len:307 (-),score=37.21 TRINITY_DN61490_c0_g1_i1:134-955(-)
MAHVLRAPVVPVPPRTPRPQRPSRRGPPPEVPACAASVGATRDVIRPPSDGSVGCSGGVGGNYATDGGFVSTWPRVKTTTPRSLPPLSRGSLAGATEGTARYGGGSGIYAGGGRNSAASASASTAAGSSRTASPARARSCAESPRGSRPSSGVGSDVGHSESGPASGRDVSTNGTCVSIIPIDTDSPSTTFGCSVGANTGGGGEENPVPAAFDVNRRKMETKGGRVFFRWSFRRGAAAAGAAASSAAAAATAAARGTRGHPGTKYVVNGGHRT